MDLRRRSNPSSSSTVLQTMAATSLVALGCGAQAEGESPPPRVDDVPADAREQPTDTPRSDEQTDAEGRTNGDADQADFATNALPACEPGPARQRGQRCVFMADDRCYEEQIMACACVCPRDRPDSVCISGFPDYSGEIPTVVTCR